MCGPELGQTGPLVRRLQGYGNLERLVWTLGGGQQGHAQPETKVANKARALGRDLLDKQQGIVVSQMKKYLFVSLVKAQSLCLLNRLCFLGEVIMVATGRKDLTSRLEEGRQAT